MGFLSNLPVRVMELGIYLLIGIFISFIQAAPTTSDYGNSYGIYITANSDCEFWENCLLDDAGCTIDQVTKGLYIATCPQMLTKEQMEELRKLEAEVEYVSFHEVTPKIYQAETVDNNPQLLNSGQDHVKEKMDIFRKMGVTQAWTNGYTGRGVLVAVVDVGVNPKHPYLSPNIDIHHSINLVNNNTGVYAPGSPFIDKGSEHGNNCAGLVAAVDAAWNDCGPGAAYDAKISVIRVFGRGVFHSTKHLAKGLAAFSDFVDVYSNSWGPRASFSKMDFPTRKVLEIKTKEGRGTKGSIYVFPAGPVADGYASNIHTIAVNGLNRGGHMAGFTVDLSSSVLTSAFGDGMRTTISLPNGLNCTNNFSGLSAAVPVVAGIIALAIQVNKNLTWRDVQHLVVKSSSRYGLPDYNSFRVNAAGLLYHNGLGFGLINASKMTELAREWKNVHFETSISVNNSAPCTSDTDEYSGREYCLHQLYVRACDVMKVEHVIVSLDYSISDEKNTEIHLKSPSGTRSILMGQRQSRENDISRRDVSFMSVHFWDENPAGTWKLILLPLDHGLCIIITSRAFGNTIIIIFTELQIRWVLNENWQKSNENKNYGVNKKQCRI